MRKLAFAYTQYHLLNLINLCQTKLVNDEVDLIAFNPEESGVVQLLDRGNKKGTEYHYKNVYRHKEQAGYK